MYIAKNTFLNNFFFILLQILNFILKNKEEMYEYDSSELDSGDCQVRETTRQHFHS